MHLGADGGHDIEILSTAAAKATLSLSTTALFPPPGDGEGWLFCALQWPLHRREGKALAGHNGSF